MTSVNYEKGKNGTIGLQVGAGHKNPKAATKPLVMHTATKGIAPKQFFREFRVHPDYILPVGWEFNALHFVPGQFVDIQGTTYVL